MTNLTKALLISILAITLSACGGGGGGDSTGSGPGTGNVGGGGGDGGGDGGGGDTGGGDTGGGDTGGGGYEDPTITITTSHGNPNSKISVDEGGVLTINVDISGGEGDESLSASVSSKDSDFSIPEKASIENGFTFTFNEVPYKEQGYTITITGTKGSDSLSDTLEVSAFSVKGDNVFEFATAVNNTLPAQRQLIAEWLMIERLVKGVNLSGGDIDIKDIKPLYVQATSGDGANDDALLGGYTNEAKLTEYTDNIEPWDEAFKNFLENISMDTCSSPRCFSEHLLRVKPMFDYVFERSGGVIQEPSYGDVKFDSNTKTYSVFYVAPDNGSFDEEGNWTFNPEYEYLADIIVAGHEAALTFSEAE
jgi:hypothetical protein